MISNIFRVNSIDCASVTMKLLFIFTLTIIGVNSDDTVPLIPGDNSHYVEGISRYIWISNDQSNPVLVDLQEPVESRFLNYSDNVDNQYFLYTRSNPNSPQRLVANQPSTIWNSNYNPNLPLNVLVHGWTGGINSAMNRVLINAFLTNADCNVIVVDWSHRAGGTYVSAVVGVASVGEYLGNLLTWLVSAGADWNNVHLVGYSLGAHVVGVAGRSAGSKPSRVTGLDPAGPLWTTNNNALRATDAVYVESIHTDAGAQGIIVPVGQASFFPNGGMNQPGCSSSQCSHSHAYDLFASTIIFDQHFGRQCINLIQALANNCSGNIFSMGNAVINKRGNGVFGLQTTATWPFF